MYIMRLRQSLSSHGLLGSHSQAHRSCVLFRGLGTLNCSCVSLTYSPRSTRWLTFVGAGAPPPVSAAPGASPAGTVTSILVGAQGGFTACREYGGFPGGSGVRRRAAAADARAKDLTGQYASGRSNDQPGEVVREPSVSLRGGLRFAL